MLLGEGDPGVWGAEISDTGDCSLEQDMICLLNWGNEEKGHGFSP